mmetsp:Transcript_1191/g.2552  ORF Transcript_1191/g.2552 Transcript_1191/m.2552 type:complete len:239 (-) Transcript_1191:3070-3786(-)
MFKSSTFGLFLMRNPLFFFAKEKKDPSGHQPTRNDLPIRNPKSVLLVLLVDIDFDFASFNVKLGIRSAFCRSSGLGMYICLPNDASSSSIPVPSSRNNAVFFSIFFRNAMAVVSASSDDCSRVKAFSASSIIEASVIESFAFIMTSSSSSSPSRMKPPFILYGVSRRDIFLEPSLLEIGERPSRSPNLKSTLRPCVSRFCSKSFGGVFSMSSSSSESSSKPYLLKCFTRRIHCPMAGS